MAAKVLSFREHAWLADEHLQALFDTLDTGSGATRVVGGAIRNALMGEPVADIDLATTLSPQRVMESGKRAGLRVIPTGLDHGTVTLVVESELGPRPFEVTTLRRDLRTDGRRAEVAFTDDWAADAARRDFTINALYCDRHGVILDPLNGLPDIEARIIRFVGDPVARIREDYLRILRFFRFGARYGAEGLDPDGLAACEAERAGLARLSAERLRQEWYRLIVAPAAVPVVEIMGRVGILADLIGSSIAISNFINLTRIESGLAREPDALLRSFILWGASAPLITTMRNGLRLTNAERVRLERLVAAGRITPSLRPNERRAVLYRLGTETYRDAVLLGWSLTAPPGDHDWHELFQLAETWPPPVFPVRGSDLLQQGIQPGPELGVLLETLEDYWIATDFSADRDDLFGRIKTLRSAN